ncbi:MAG TPA: ABC transporter permease, partial [Actinomycetota bacterium]
MLRATLKGLLAHKFRLALTAIAVVLGVAFVAGTLVLTDTIAKAFDEVFASAQEGVDVEVRAEASDLAAGGDRERIPEELLSVIQRVEGVDRVEGGVTGYAQIVDASGEATGTTGAPTFGISWPTYEGFSALSIREGRAPLTGGEVAIDAATAERHGFVIGDRVTVLFQGPQEEFQVVGIAGFGDADNLAGATMAAFDVATAQRVLGAEDTFDSIFVAADEGVGAAELRDRISEVLPQGAEAQTGAAVAAEQADAIKDALGFFNTFLLVFAAIALFVGAFIIFNTFNILVTQRTRELALLRALGASPRQVTLSVLTEAGIVGLAASVVGLGLGILVAFGLRALLAGFGIDLPSASLQILPRTIAVAFLVGILVTLVAALMPARRAARISPIAAMKAVETVRPLDSRRRMVIGGALVAGGVALGLVGLFGGGDSALQAVGIGVAATFIGTAILSPLIAQPLARAIGSPLPRLAHLPGKLGRENAMRNPRRTASTSAALMIGLALVGTFLILGSSLKTSVGQT